MVLVEGDDAGVTRQAKVQGAADVLLCRHDTVQYSTVQYSAVQYLLCRHDHPVDEAVRGRGRARGQSS